MRFTTKSAPRPAMPSRRPAVPGLASFVVLAIALEIGLDLPTARADQAVIGPSRDTSIYEEFGTRSNGAGEHLFAGQSNSAFDRRGLLYFDVAGALPAGSTVTSVELHLYCDRTKSQDETVSLHRVSASWGEGTSNATGEEGQGVAASASSATWTHASYTTTTWSVPGGSFVASPSTSLTVRGANQFYVFTGTGLVADVQSWLGSPAANFGWILRGNEVTPKSAKRFASREATDLAQRPYLVIGFTPPAVTTGACCTPLGTCTLVVAPGAANCGTSYQGDGTSCSPNLCPQPSGACCLPDPMATCVSATSAACTTMGGTHEGALTSCTPNPCPVVLAPYVDALPIPAVAQPTSGVPGDTASYEMAIRETWQQLHRDLPPTRVWGYDDGLGTTYPGPTFETRSERPITVTWRNDLRDTNDVLRTSHLLPVDLCTHGAADDAQVVVHLHGGHVPPDADGYPESTFLPGEQVVYAYPNHQPGATIWYHDHALGVTRLNVYAGLAGLYVVRDDLEDSLGLPSGAYEIPLAIQDRSFHPDGSLAYPDMFMEHFFGDVVLVNGKVWPYLDVARGKYRFRVLNGSNSRSYHLAFSNGMGFHVIGGDGGLLPAPIATTDLTLAPGERAEIVVDFAALAPTTEIELVNDASAPYPGVPGENSIREVMLFRVGSATGHTAALPTTLRPMTPLDAGLAVTERTLVLDKMSDPTCGGSMWTINDLGWNDITEFPVLGSSEVWSFVNRSGMSHPMHMHMVFFQVLDRHTFVDVGGVPTPTGAPLPLLATETGWKDTVQVGPGEMVRVVAHFEDYLGLYPYHCHILEHEDHEMMRQFQTTTSCGDGILSAPYEDCDDGNVVALDGCETDCRSTCEMPSNCADADPCTVDACLVGTGCTHAPLDCDDGNECTTDACGPASGCANPVVVDGTPCSFGSCVLGVCTAPVADAGMGTDAGVPTDAGANDAGTDAGTSADAGTDATSPPDATSSPDAGAERRASSGCSCRIVAAPRPPTGGGAFYAAALAGFFVSLRLVRPRARTRRH